MIACFEMKNAGPFKGEHRIDLTGGAYAIIARHEQDPKKSNGVGKSFILEMIRFAITGELSDAREGTIDRWINHDCKDAMVRLTFEDGAQITRSKTRKVATQVRFTAPGRGEAAQADADVEILKYLALTADDFMNAAYLEQRKMAKLVDPSQTKPGDRLEIVSGWFGLGLAERSEDIAGDRAAEHERSLTRDTEKRNALLSRLDEEVQDVDIEAAKKNTARLEAEIAAMKAERKLAQNIEDHGEIVDQQKKRIEDGLRMKAVLDGMTDVEAEAKSAEEEIQRLTSTRDAIREDERQKRKVSLGMFDGRCPVASIECPAKDEINNDRAASTKAHAAVKHDLMVADAALDIAREKYAPIFHQRTSYAATKKNLDAKREEVRDHAPAAKASKEWLATVKRPDVDYPNLLAYEKAFNERADEAMEALTKCRTTIAVAEERKTVMERTRLMIKTLDAEIEVRKRAVSLHLRACAIFRIAQRRVAERNLSFVEDESNYQLAEAGIDLRVAARWEREAGGPAKTCEECGAAFPSSAKVKTCERCGTARGQHTTQRLDFIMSDRSGALADLGGITMQLSAGAWLLNARHSPWGTALLDEPFAACDVYNRRALAVQLMKLLGRGTWRQAIVISHSNDTVEVFPKKIVITAHADGRRSIEVQ